MQVLKIRENARNVEEISWQIARAKKMVVVTGAGISTSSGIPDFRSKGGLYEMIKDKFPNEKVTGQQLFDKSYLNNEKIRKMFYTFMGELYSLTTAAVPTMAHRFFKRLADQKKIIHYYTQNIDNLEAAVNLDAVQLHGTMSEVYCDMCKLTVQFTEMHAEVFKKGFPPQCNECQQREATRQASGKRKHRIGDLQPNITLYNDIDDTTRGAYIQNCVKNDLRKKIDYLLIAGTSLKVHGVKNLIRQLAKSVHHNGGKVVLVNLSGVGKEWNTVFDYQILADVDEWAGLVEEHTGLDKTQKVLTGLANKTSKSVNVSISKGCVKRRRKDRDQDRENAGSNNDNNKKKALKRSKVEVLDVVETLQ
ncbi:7527_t:CDS:2 [Ambispora gerdemannii]|uniref:7527_t:CDS:1 n=1 Tax=Ambispora gerdemannii TaxID=144530 RepID=A0A9N9DMQ0_9GLOM|nr:7527_t:CDS:2 [Ambispora gerdemannii]